MKKHLRFLEKNCVMRWMPVAIFGVISLMGCAAENGGQILNEEKLQEIKIGSVVKLSDLIHGKADTICVLYPYQTEVANSNPNSVVINKYLQDIKYQASEGYWSLVTSAAGSVNHYSFRRSKVLDVYDMPSHRYVDLPSNFERAECASFDRAALFKTSIGDRIYVIFGSVK